MSETVSPTYQVSAATRDFFATRAKKMLIGPSWVDAKSGQVIDIVDPASEEVVATAPRGGAEDVDAAVMAASNAFQGVWRSFPPVERERLLHRLADMIEANLEHLAELESIDNGKPLKDARNIDISASLAFVRYMAGWPTKVCGETVPISPPPIPGLEAFAYTRREPVGVVAAIVPWNYPFAIALWKVIPALAAGCTVVLKPAELTPLTALVLGRLALDAGIPPGVLNIVTGLGAEAGAALVQHPGVRKISFTGSTDVGKVIGRAAMDNMTRVSLELGGKSPMIVLGDADLDTAIFGLARGIFFNNGQNCTAGSRMYVHESIYDKVVAGVAQIGAGMRIGHGLNPETELGPVVSRSQMDRINGYIESGIAEGAELITGGVGNSGKGFFVRPTVLANATDDMRIVREEIFGPVLAVSSFKDEEEALTRANATHYGLSASIWSNHLSKVNRLIPRLDAGTVWVNMHNLLDWTLPFGGMKHSGIGREFGRQHVESFTENKSVMMFY